MQEYLVPSGPGEGQARVGKGGEEVEVNSPVDDVCTSAVHALFSGRQPGLPGTLSRIWDEDAPTELGWNTAVYSSRCLASSERESPDPLTYLFNLQTSDGALEDGAASGAR